MKIATWNIERPSKTSKRLPDIINCLKEINADIVILTETNEYVDLGSEYEVYHTALPAADFPVKGIPTPILYKDGERRVSIFSKYPFIGQLPTFDDQVAICIQLETPLGALAVYGTIIGIFGNTKPGFKEHLELQLKDYKTIAGEYNLCIAGDLNICFAAEKYYHTEDGRNKLNEMMKELNLRNMTGFLPNNIDHIIITDKFLGKKSDLQTWNTEKKEALKRLSDHNGVAVTLV